MENKLPVTQCQYCGSRDIGEGWQHGEALVTFRKRGLSGNRLRYLLCRQCGAILYRQTVCSPLIRFRIYPLSACPSLLISPKNSGIKG